MQAERAKTQKTINEHLLLLSRYLRLGEQTFLGVGPNGRIHTFNLNFWRATFTYNVYYMWFMHTLHTIKIVSSQNHALKLEFCTHLTGTREYVCT